MPADAVAAGQDGEQLFVARARHDGALIPGKLVPSHGCAYVSCGGGEHAHQDYEVLCGCSGTWVPVTGSSIPPNAVPAGENSDGEPLFVGRANHEGTLTPGKVQVNCFFLAIVLFGGLIGYFLRNHMASATFPMEERSSPSRSMRFSAPTKRESCDESLNLLII